MSFLIFFIYYFLSTLILLTLVFILYKLFFQKLISTKLAENTLLSAFDSLDQKSILDIDLPEEEKKGEDDKKSQEEENEKIYTYF